MNPVSSYSINDPGTGIRAGKAAPIYLVKLGELTG